MFPLRDLIQPHAPARGLLKSGGLPIGLFLQVKLYPDTVLFREGTAQKAADKDQQCRIGKDNMPAGGGAAQNMSEKRTHSIPGTPSKEPISIRAAEYSFNGAPFNHLFRTTVFRRFFRVA